ncbi:MAG: heat-inducible transcription repressor HrcA [Chthonomonadales bacterium]|nr:heat-inducible transcription repressor HrcA [Chthonomonadales bacterium]
MEHTLSARKQRILQAVVSDYVTTAEPVGSQWLASRYDFGCRSATLRNEMCEMVEEGYLVQPHTSAGRVPTATGYRYYVDRLMTPVPPDRPQRVAARRRLERAAEDVQETVRDACRVLADLTQYPSVASTPTSGEVSLHRVFLAAAGHRHVLLVALLSTGHVENRIVELPHAVDDRAVATLGERLNQRVAGRAIRDLAVMSRLEQAVPADPADETMRRMRGAIHQMATAFSDEHLFFEGTSYMLRQREFRDLLRLEQLLSALMDRRVLVQVLRSLPSPEGVVVLIGPESRVDAMDECSLVTTRYRAGAESWGYIGVLGPTRMDYDRAVAAVDLMARSLSSVLARINPIPDSERTTQGQSRGD